jgi:hypothetical protein
MGTDEIQPFRDEREPLTLIKNGFSVRFLLAAAMMAVSRAFSPQSIL